MENKYIGHSNQFYGVEVHRLMGGKGDGMRLLEVNNGKGLQLTISLDRCGDISRLIYKGIHNGSLKRLLKDLKIHKEGYLKNDIIFKLMGSVVYSHEMIDELALDLLIDEI